MRHADWPERLPRFYRARRNEPFAWGANDCATFAADWVLEMTGTDPIADIRGWTDALEAMRVMQSLGGFRQAVSDRLGDPIDWRLAPRGGVVMMHIDGRDSLAVCIGAHAMAPGIDGALLVPMPQAEMAWRVD